MFKKERDFVKSMEYSPSKPDSPKKKAARDTTIRGGTQLREKKHDYSTGLSYLSKKDSPSSAGRSIDTAPSNLKLLALLTIPFAKSAPHCDAAKSAEGL